MQTGFGIYAKIAHDIIAGKASLPNLPDAALRIRRAMQDPSCDLARIEQIIQTDAGLSGYLIQMANSPAYRGWRQTKDLKRALSLFGMEMTRNLCLGYSLRSMFHGRDPLLKTLLLEHWKRSAHRAAFCTVLAGQVRHISPDRALLAGLLQEIGMPLLYVRLENTPEALGDPELLQDLEDTFCATISQTLLASWCLDAELQDVARNRHNWLRDHRGKADLADLVTLVNLHELRLVNDPTRYLPDMQTIPAYDKLKPGAVSVLGTLVMLDESVDIAAIEATMTG
ncbi:HD-like signal output (HDOD) domain, no enzymatic activity [Allochromatium warmingii]|uniref:HD-like signal output (HDOD) domain, no enzymatic activity n=1 Tax=Allochromatium warmingii TaxID=61595 RepID=A0A1H3BYQ7_ALLWA|nr:HDOD domain-containing protein [Allochromatium warmingii]SDX47006.1 HD-like signal output (HDOD) domain, no enzymatic activity [Allochromatium warmingii]